MIVFMSFIYNQWAYNVMTFTQGHIVKIKVELHT